MSGDGDGDGDGDGNDSGRGGAMAPDSGNAGSSGSGGTGSGGSAGNDNAGPSGGAGGSVEAGTDTGPDPNCDADCPDPNDELLLAPGHPEPRRFALTDESTAVADQPRLWLLVPDDDGSHRLLSLRPSTGEYDADEWLDTGVDDVTSNPEGVSFAEDGVQQQRVFFIRDGVVQMLTPNDLGGAAEDAGASSPFTFDDVASTNDEVAFDGGDLGAVSFERNGTRRIAVLVPAAIEGRAGGYCVLEIDGEAISQQCSAAAKMHAQTDVAGAVVGDEVHFYFRTQDNGLYRVTRESEGSYEGTKLELPADTELAPSLVAIASEIPDHVELLVITTDGELFGARPLATSRTSPVWAPLPQIAEGVQASTAPAALAAVVLYEDITETGKERKYLTTELRVIGDDDQLHQVTTDDLDDTRPWRHDWKHVDAIERGQEVLAIGAIANMPINLGGFLQFGSAWSVVGTARATTLQEAITLITYIYWYDHVRMSRRAPLPGSTSLAELASAVGGDGALVAATTRAAGPPFSVTLFGSLDGATTFESALLPAHLEDPSVATSLMQPSVRYAGGEYHLAALERALPGDCVERDGEQRRITYRRAGNAAALASLQPDDNPNYADDYFIVRSGSDYVDNVTLAITEGEFGTTAHLVHNVRSARDLAYWRLGARASKAPAEVMFGGALDPHDMPDGPPVLATGLAETVYVATADANRFEVCQLPPNGVVTDESCSDLSTTARLDARELPFGAPREQPYGICAGDAAPYYACLRDDRPFSIAVDRGAYPNPANDPPSLAPQETRNHRIVVVYQGVAPSAPTGASTSIWLTIAPGGDAIGGWTAPIEISRREPGDTRHFFDPEVTIDERHRVSVTYSAIDAAPAQGQRAQVYVAQAELDWDGSLQVLAWFVAGSDIHQAELGSWSPEGLPFDCVTGRAALGAYRESDTIDARALHVLRGDEGHDAIWLNKYARE